MARIINKGIQTIIVARGNLFKLETEYTATLYYSVRHQEGRASTIAKTEIIEGTPTVTFVFPPSETSKLKVGEVILEIYDTNGLGQMSFVENFATVRASSLSA